MEQENDHPSTFLKSARKGVTGWFQQRLLEASSLKQNTSSSPTAPSNGTSHFAPEGLRPGNNQSSPQFAADRLCFPVSFQWAEVYVRTRSSTIALCIDRKSV